VKEAFFWFEVEVVKLGYFEDVVNCALVVVEVGMSGDADIIHVDMDCRPKGFVFEDGVAVDVVHHGLECCWGVGESEIHHGRFKESVSGFKRGFLLIPFMNLDVVVTPSDIEFCVYVCITEVSNEVCN